MFLLLARSGAASPGELSEKLGKSKFVVSQELAKLKEASLVVEVGRAKSENKDMRRKTIRPKLCDIGRNLQTGSRA